MSTTPSARSATASPKRGILEFERTKEIVLRQLPTPPSVVADIGGGPGRYALWLAERGHRVEHRDLMPLHVDQLRAVADPSRINAAVADARDLDLGDGAVDAVLLLGPVYHLRRRDQRLGALREAWRVVRPGGPVFVAAIFRWAPRLDGELRLRLYKSLPAIRELIPSVERTGWMTPLSPGSFSAYYHRPRQLRAELRGAGFQVLDLVAVEGVGFCCTTSTSGWPIRWTAPWCWTPPAPPNGFRSCSGSGRICLRRRSVQCANPPGWARRSAAGAKAGSPDVLPESTSLLVSRRTTCRASELLLRESPCAMVGV